MKVKSLKINFLLNSYRIASAAIIGIFTMPYINKTLGASNLGKVEFIYTIINYFILFSALGIPMYGIREIAKVRDNIVERNKKVIELLIILTITSFISYIILFGILYQLDYFFDYRDIILLMSFMIFLNNLGAEWYFQALEDQMYITVRYVIVRVITLLLLFLLVKDSNDYLYYAFILVLTVCGSNFFNIYFILRGIRFKTIKNLNLKQHFKPILTVFIATLAVNIYLQLDLLLIGLILDDKYVGYYSVPTKLIRIAISFITIIGAVMLPRLTIMFKDDLIAYNNLLKKVFNIILMLSIPTFLLFFLGAEAIINLMAGNDFENAVLTTKILAPLGIIVGIAYFVGYLILYTQNREKIYTIAVGSSALFSAIVNYFSIQYYKHNGAAIVHVFAEFLAIVIMLVFTRKEFLNLKILNFNVLKIIVAGILTFVICAVFKWKVDLLNVVNFYIFLALICCTFTILLVVFKESTLVSFLNQSVLKKIKINEIKK
nr:oligosaccharide flippase family protein [uncultured Flavobacterium sp.]